MAIKNKKGSGHTEELSKELMAQLNCATAFTIPLFGGIPVAESVVVTWVIMAVLLIAAAILGRNLKVENVGKKQLVLETIVGGLYNFFYDLLGEEGKQYIPYLMTVGVYIGFANMIGLFGLKSPTKDVGVTGALALMSIILIEAAGVRKKGTKGFLKSFAEPIPIMDPIANMIPKTGRIRLRTASPFAPELTDIKKVSARIYTDCPIILATLWKTYFVNFFSIIFLHFTDCPLHYSKKFSKRQ